MPEEGAQSPGARCRRSPCKALLSRLPSALSAASSVRIAGRRPGPSRGPQAGETAQTSVSRFPGGGCGGAARHARLPRREPCFNPGHRQVGKDPPFPRSVSEKKGTLASLRCILGKAAFLASIPEGENSFSQAVSEWDGHSGFPG